MRANGNSLGELGSRIVCETIIGLLRLRPELLSTTGGGWDAVDAVQAAQRRPDRDHPRLPARRPASWPEPGRCGGGARLDPARRFTLPLLRRRAPVGVLGAGERQGGVDQRHVGEGLGEVADQAPRAAVVLLGQQADVVARARAAARTARAPRPPLPSSIMASASQKVQARNSALAGRQAVDPSSACRSAATKPSTISSRSIASTVPRMRGSSAGRKPISGIMQQARVELREP